MTLSSKASLNEQIIEKALEFGASLAGIMDFDPCTDCEKFCRKACPQKAFGEKIYSEEPLAEIKNN